MLLNRIKLILAATLISLYIATLWIMTHPHVSQEYKDHYITRSSDCWFGSRGTKAIDSADTVDIAKLSDRESCRYLRAGWRPVTSRGSEAREPDLLLDVPYKPGTAAIHLVFDQQPGHPEEGEVALENSASEIKVYFGPPGQNEVSIPVADTPTPDAQWHLSIRIETPQALWNDHSAAPIGSRHVALKTIRYEPAVQSH